MATRFMIVPLPSAGDAQDRQQ